MRNLKPQVGLSYGSTQRAARSLHLKPYKVSLLHELEPGNPVKRLEYCPWFLQYAKLLSNLDLTFFSENAWFALSGYVNAQNNRYWSQENSYKFIESPLHSQKIRV